MQRALFLVSILFPHLTILGHLKAAMEGGFVILIDDIVVPNTNVSWRATAMDLTMMIGLGSVERTGEQWRALLSSAGMKISKMYSNSQFVHDSIIVAIPA